MIGWIANSRRISMLRRIVIPSAASFQSTHETTARFLPLFHRQSARKIHPASGSGFRSGLLLTPVHFLPILSGGLVGLVPSRIVLLDVLVPIF